MKNDLFLERKLKIPSHSTGTVDKEIIVQIFSPVSAAKEWRCSYALSHCSAPKTMLNQAYGADGLQALINAIEAVRQLVVLQFPEATWLSGNKGDIGFPIIVCPYAPLSHPEFVLLHAKMWQLVDRHLQNQKRKGRKLRT